MNANINNEHMKFEKHLRILQDVVRIFFQFEINLEEILKIALKSLMEDLDFDTVFVFLYNESYNSLEYAQGILRGKGIIAGEGRIPVTDKKDDLISTVFLGKMDFALWGDRLHICMGLQEGNDKMGVLVADKLLCKKPISEEEIIFLSDYAREFSRGLRHIKVLQANLHRINMLLALSRISEAIASTMEVESVLSIILNSAVEILKFDRAKLYLIDKEENLLKGQISADIRRVVKPIAAEKYPLKAGVNRLVDTLLEAGIDSSKDSYGTAELFFYVPLKAKESKIGILAVDNIFSRKPITKEEKEGALILANHAAVTLENAKMYQKVKELSIRDSLTGLYVHGYFLQRLDEEISRAKRFKKGFSLMIIDIDDFKRFNDIYGHLIGDKLLEILSNLLKQNSRAIDIAARYGGDELVLMLPGASQETSILVGKRIRELVKQQRLRVDGEEKVFTVSIGIATYPQDGVIREDLIKKADEALYWAKQHGKDQVCLAKDLPNKL